MNSFNKINNIIGWVVGVIASIVYLMTMEATVSLWDCGEFISCAYKLEVSHSPGAPFFSILARVWILLFGDNPETVATAVNSLSAVSSGLTIMFLFWTITHLGRKIVKKQFDEPAAENLLVWGAGLVGAFAFCFSDTFWFSAVEGEVYALSSFIMALIFWAMLKWENVADQAHADRWILFISLVMGMAIGVHLLNLLTIPALVLIYYFRKAKQVNLKGGLMALAIGAALLAMVQYGIILWLPNWAFKLDVALVNGMGAPFYLGIVLFYILVVAALVFGAVVANRRGMYFLKLGVWSIMFILIGYSTYVSMVFRSAANPPIDMGSPDTAPRLNSFLSREQFGSVPLLSGPYYVSYNQQMGDIIGVKEIAPDYFESDGKYEYLDYKREYEFSSESKKFFPRIWDGNNPAHVQFYNQWLGIQEGERPSFGDNFKFFFQHQLWHMYMRYFMWNYAGRANDYQGRFYGEPMKSPWVSGIKFLDEPRVGDLDKLPDAYSKSKARNNLYMFPLLLGIAGMFFHYKRSRNDFWTTLALFFFTGIAIMIFVNNTPDQPRERDYSYVGSTYAYAIWIGLGVMAIAYFIKDKLLKNLQISAIVTTVACFLLVPVIMASQEWNDHDRSQKTIGKSTGYNYLMACAPNAVLFTEGDNDTYPLWFCQEVLGYRRDVRIINLSLLNIDWYIDQLNYKVNDAPAVKMLWEPKDYVSSTRDIVQLAPNAIKTPVDLTKALKFNLNEKNMMRTMGGGAMSVWPARTMKITVDKEAVKRNNIVPAYLEDKIVDEMVWDLGSNTLRKNALTVLNIIAANMWDRPIYFSSTIRPENYQGLEKYLLLEGSILRFSPVFNPTATPNEPGTMNIDKSWDLLMNKYTFGGADNPNVYFDEPNRRALTNFRASYTKLAKALIAQKGDKKRAKQALDYISKKISLVCLPYDLSTVWMVEAYYQADDKESAAKLAKAQLNETMQLGDYIRSLSSSKQSFDLGDLQFGVQIAMQFAQWANMYGDQATLEDITNQINKLAMSFPSLISPQQVQQAQEAQAAAAAQQTAEANNTEEAPAAAADSQ